MRSSRVRDHFPQADLPLPINGHPPLRAPADESTTTSVQKLTPIVARTNFGGHYAYSFEYRLVLKSADILITSMKTFGTVLSEARKAKGISQKELATKVKKEDGQAISPQYLNDIEHDRRNPPSEFIIGQIAKQLDFDKDTLCLAAGTVSSDLMKMAASQPDKIEQAFKAFRKTVKGN